MKIHIIQHTPTVSARSTEDWIKSKGYKATYTRFFEPDHKLPNHDEFDFLIINGGEMNVDDENQHPWMRAEKAFIKEAIDKNKKVLGICLGGQLIAEVLGAKVGPHPHQEIGWIKLTFNNNEKSIMAFSSHGYSFEIPKNATPMASSLGCKNQGFTYGKNVIGLQFHPESTEAFVRSCADEAPEPGPFVQSPEELINGCKYLPELQAWYFKILDSF